jgi:hypothetical protein
MRRITAALVVVAASVAFAGYAPGAVLLNETFSYADGNLVPNGGWAQLSTDTGSTVIQVVSSRAQGSSSANPDDHKTFPAQPTNVTTYAAFRVRISDPGGLPKPIYFAELTDGVVATPAIVARLFVLPITGGFTFGVSHANPTNGVAAWSSQFAGTLTYGTDYTVVTNYNPVAKTSTLWVNPASQGDPSVTVTDATMPAAIAVASVALRQSFSSSSTGSYPLQASGTLAFNWSVDGLSVGTTFADAIAGVDPCNTDAMAPAVTPPSAVTVTQTSCV